MSYLHIHFAGSNRGKCMRRLLSFLGRLCSVHMASSKGLSCFWDKLSQCQVTYMG